AILDLDDARRRKQTPDSDKAAAALADLKKKIDEVRKAVEDGLKSEARDAPIKAGSPSAAGAARSLDGLRTALKEWVEYNDPPARKGAAARAGPFKAADRALEQYGVFLREKVAGLRRDDSRIGGQPIGREALLVELAGEMIPYTPEELVAIAEKEFAWCEAEMKKAAGEMGFADWRKAVEKVKTLHVEPGKQPAVIRSLAVEAIDYLRKHDLVTVPPLAAETWRMEMMSPQRQL